MSCFKRSSNNSIAKPCTRGCAAAPQGAQWSSNRCSDNRRSNPWIDGDRGATLTKHDRLVHHRSLADENVLLARRQNDAQRWGSEQRWDSGQRWDNEQWWNNARRYRDDPRDWRRADPTYIWGGRRYD